MTVRKIEYDFGKGFDFSEERIKIDTEELERYQSGTSTPIGGKYKGFVYTEGYYPKVVLLQQDIPTFDSSDREYDSWHELYLVQNADGNIHAVYCCGGYRIASIDGFAKVLAYPDDLKHYFQ